MSTETKDTYYNYHDYCLFRKVFENALYKSDIKSVDTNNEIISSIPKNIKDRFISLCATIKDYVSHSDIIRLSDVTNPCNYINFYLKIELKYQKYSDKKDTFNNIKKYIQFVDKNNTCISKMIYIDDVIFNKMKKLYSLYDNYEALFEGLRYHDQSYSCTELKDLVKEFNSFILSNKKTTNKHLFDKLKYFKCLLDNVELIKQEKCVGIEKLSSPYVDSEENAIQCRDQEQKTARLEEHEKSQIKERDAKESRAEQEKHHGLPGVGKPGGFERVERQEEKLYTDIRDPLGRTDNGISDISEEIPNLNTSNPVGTIIGTSLGFVLPLITMYKFTPLGTWINTKILGRNNIMKNIKNNNQDFLLNSSENPEMKLGDTMNRVTYSSATN
ncbi:Plasmodium vivax Vir protein, putative [Plasmodium vivax]|nr:Plasmodium vivax Vir protein, putative [Plasmodium vivax]